jgi:hypothetical protein
MKKVLCAVAVLLLVGLGGTAFAQGNSPMLICGTQELGLSGSVDFDDPTGDVSLDIFASYGISSWTILNWAAEPDILGN